MVLFKLSKSNPYLASMWQYFLILCNFQDPEYWQLSTEKGSKFYLSSGGPRNSTDGGISSSTDQINQNDADYYSSSSSNANSLNPEIQQISQSTSISPDKARKANKLRKKSKAKQQSFINYEQSKQALVLSSQHAEHPTLNEQLFRYLSMTIYCDYIATRNQLDNTVGLTMILVNNLVELFELSAHEPNVCDLFSTIHR